MTNTGNYIGLAEPVSTTVPTGEAELAFEKGRERGRKGGREGGRKVGITQAGHVWQKGR